MAPKKTREEHVAELAFHGQVELLGDYIDQNTLTLYRCIEHGEEHSTTPKVTARGSGLQCCQKAAARRTNNKRKERAAATYDLKLKELGRVSRIGTYTGTKTKILHRCLIHGETHEVTPASVLQGHGLKCCRGSGSGEDNPNFIRARDRYDQKIAELGRVVRVAEYESAHKPVAHRCLEHGEIHPISPTSALAGTGLKCCRLAGIKKSATRSTAAAAGRYDEEIAAHGKVERIEPFVESGIAILHRCLIHGEEHEARPSACRRGHGLKCCWRSKNLETQLRRTKEAASTYDAALASFGLLERLEAYAGARTPILHRCLIHGEEQMASPTNCRRGKGLGCCRRAAFTTDSIDCALAGSGRYEGGEAVSLYIFEMANHPGYVKPGIAIDIEFRARCSGGQYGDLVAAWSRERRLNVYLPEQVLLKATRLVAHCPPALRSWVGATEVRRMEADALVAMAQELMDEIDACTNPWEFAIAHGLLTPAQEKRAQVLIRAGVVSEAELSPLAV